MERKADSHKGQNGTVAVIGGSRHQHGAPLFCALAAEATGMDLLYVALPACHENVAKQASLNFQVHSFAGDNLAMEDTKGILNLLQKVDSAVIGPGIDTGEESIQALRAIIEHAPCAMVLDATALQPWTLELASGKSVIVTPHAGELERMGITNKELKEKALQYKVTILCKGPMDCIAAFDGSTQEITGGNAGLTVGGTGDALAGLLAGLLAQGMSPFDAADEAAFALKKCGEDLFCEKGYLYTTQDVIDRIPMAIQ